MRIRLVAAGTRPPRWVAEGYRDYAERLRAPLRLELHEVALGGRRGAGEGERLRRAIPGGARVVALEREGELWDTPGLAARLEAWMHGGRDVALLVGGPEGLDAASREAAETRWSLSPLTLPHMLVRVLVAEQLYRAWTLLSGHPYHR